MARHPSFVISRHIHRRVTTARVNGSKVLARVTRGLNSSRLECFTVLVVVVIYRWCNCITFLAMFRICSESQWTTLHLKHWEVLNIVLDQLLLLVFLSSWKNRRRITSSIPVYHLLFTDLVYRAVTAYSTSSSNTTTGWM